MQYVRVYADAAGESHFEDVAVPLASVDFAPPAPPVNLSAFHPAARYGFLVGPPGWDGGWHPAPSGRCCSTSPGKSRRRSATARCGASGRGASPWWRTPPARGTGAATRAPATWCSPWCNSPTERRGRTRRARTTARWVRQVTSPHGTVGLHLAAYRGRGQPPFLRTAIGLKRSMGDFAHRDCCGSEQFQPGLAGLGFLQPRLGDRDCELRP